MPRYKTAAELLARATGAALEGAKNPTGLQLALQHGEVADCARLILVGHGGPHSVGPTRSGTDAVRAETLAKLLVEHAPHAAEVILITCHAAAFASNLHEKVAALLANGQTRRFFGVVGIGNGELRGNGHDGMPKELAQREEELNSGAHNAEAQEAPRALVGVLCRGER